MNGRRVAHCELSFTPQPDLFEAGPLWLRRRPTRRDAARPA
jgi:hypothetical protein